MIYDSENWRADWPESESYEIGPPSIAWLSWHIIYWWSMVLNHSFGDRTLQRETVPCYGIAREAIEHIYQIKKNWEDAVAQFGTYEERRGNWILPIPLCFTKARKRIIIQNLIFSILTT